MTHICVSKLTNIGSDNGMSPGRPQAIIWTNAGIMLIGPLATIFSEILIVISTFPFTKTCLKVSSVKWWPFCFGLNVLIRLPKYWNQYFMHQCCHLQNEIRFWRFSHADSPNGKIYCCLLLFYFLLLFCHRVVSASTTNDGYISCKLLTQWFLYRPKGWWFHDLSPITHLKKNKRNLLQITDKNKYRLVSV